MNVSRPEAVVHLDCDGLADIFRVHGWGEASGEDALLDGGLAHALDFFDAQRVRATLFVIGTALDVPSRRARLREAVARGHEVASHSLTHRALPALSPREKRREIVESRVRIADALGAPVRGFRAPNFAIDRESLELVAEAGYAYDSSLVPGRNPMLGPVPQGPHRVLDGALLELPLPRPSLLSLPFHPSYSLVLGTAYFRAGLAGVRRSGVPLVMLFHLTDLSDRVSAASLPTLRARFFTLSWLSRERKARRCARMLGAVREYFELTDTSSLVASWEAAR